jgi:sulfate transport system permease protein
VGGIALATVYGPKGWIGVHLAKMGINVLQTPIGIVIALIFISLPFVVRTVQPVLQELDVQIEEAASALGASRWMTFRRVLFPYIWPALLTGYTLAFARAIGEYGSVIFITSNIPFKTQITPQLIYTRLDEYDYAGATAIAVVMLVVSFTLLLAINGLQWWSQKRMRG